MVNRGNDSSQFCLYGGWGDRQLPLDPLKGFTTTSGHSDSSLPDFSTGRWGLFSPVVVMGFRNEAETNHTRTLTTTVVLKGFLELCSPIRQPLATCG